MVFRAALPHLGTRSRQSAAARRGSRAERVLLRYRCVPARRRRDHAHPHRARAPVAARASHRARNVNEIVLALAIGVLTASGVWLLLRPRTFQVVMGLTLLSYAVNLFIFAMGRLRVGAAPIVEAGRAADPMTLADPLPQALVLTAIVIGFATTALILVVLL